MSPDPYILYEAPGKISLSRAENISGCLGFAKHNNRERCRARVQVGRPTTNLLSPRMNGWEFPPRPATRIRQMEEAIQLILKMWTEPRTTFHGRCFHVEDAILEPKPVQKPRPPMMIAGAGEQMTRNDVESRELFASDVMPHFA
jgi:hypothetical protein